MIGREGGLETREDDWTRGRRIGEEGGRLERTSLGILLSDRTPLPHLRTPPSYLGHHAPTGERDG